MLVSNICDKYFEIVLDQNTDRFHAIITERNKNVFIRWRERQEISLAPKNSIRKYRKINIARPSVNNALHALEISRLLSRLERLDIPRVDYAYTYTFSDQRTANKLRTRSLREPPHTSRNSIKSNRLATWSGHDSRHRGGRGRVYKFAASRSHESSTRPSGAIISVSALLSRAQQSAPTILHLSASPSHGSRAPRNTSTSTPLLERVTGKEGASSRGMAPLVRCDTVQTFSLSRRLRPTRCIIYI